MFFESVSVWVGPKHVTLHYIITVLTFGHCADPSDWAAKAQQWAQQRQIANQYYQQQQQPQQQQPQQQVGQWPHQQHQQHQQQQPYYAQQQQQAHLQQQHQHQTSIHQQPHIPQQPQQQVAYGASVGTLPQQSHLQQQQTPLLQQQHQTSMYQQSQQGEVASSSSLVPQHQQSHSLLGGGVASGQGQLTMLAEHQSVSGSNPPAQPEPLFPQRSAPPTSSQASALPSHPYQPHPPQSQQQYGSPALQQKSSLLGDSPQVHTSTNVSSSPQSGSTASEGLLGRSPGLLKPRLLLESPQPTVRSKSPANVPTSLESGRYGPMRGNVRPPFRPQGGEERGTRRDLRFQERGMGMSEPPRPRPPMERSQGQSNYGEWEQGPPQSGGEIPTSSRPPTEEMFGGPKQEEPFDHHQQQQQQEEQQHFGEHPVKTEAEYQWQNVEEGQRELTHNFQHSTQEEEWEIYGNGQNRALEQRLEGDKDNMHGPSPYRHHQFPYDEQGGKSSNVTSSPSISISSLKSDEPTISSLRKDPMTSIPGLGGGFEEQEKDAAKSAGATTTAPQSVQRASEGEGGASATGMGVGGNQANQMIKSLGKFVSQLQTLKGLTSSLQLLQALPKGGEEAKKVEPPKPKESSEAELSEETKRKVAALLATESDSDGEQVCSSVCVCVSITKVCNKRRGIELHICGLMT